MFVVVITVVELSPKFHVSLFIPEEALTEAVKVVGYADAVDVGFKEITVGTSVTLTVSKNTC